MATRKKSRQATRGGRNGQPAWALVLLGMVLGFVACLVVVMQGWAPFLRTDELPRPDATATAPPEPEPPVAEARPRKSYDFYTVLPEAEVVIPDAELSARAREEAEARPQPEPLVTQPASETAAAGTYVLQVGSYPEAAAAEEAKARLALSGFVARVQPVTVNGRTWHRVRLGPYTSAGELESAKQRLDDQGIKAIALKEQ